MGKKAMSKYSTSIILNGIAAVLFAILAIFWTKFTLELLVMIFGIFVLAQGVFMIIGAFGAKDDHEDWWVNLLKGIIGLIIGLIIIFSPEFAGGVFVYIIAIWAIAMGILELWVSSKITNEIGGKWLITTLGIISIIIGVIVMFFPMESLVIITWIIGLFILIMGVGYIVFGMQLRK